MSNLAIANSTSSLSTQMSSDRNTYALVKRESATQGLFQRHPWYASLTFGATATVGAIPFFGLGTGAVLGVGVTALTKFALSKIYSSSTANSSTSLASSSEMFWKKVESVPTMANNGPIIIQGHTMFSSFAEGQCEMALGCTSCSEYVKKHLIHSSSRGTVLDLGCGLGANSIPLLMKGWKVIAIDKQPKVINQYFKQVSDVQKSQVTIAEDDIITYKYPKDIDAVICVDVLPYLPPKELRTTLNKIFQALRPGGKFIGTLFFGSKEHPVKEMLEKLGAHFYSDKKFVRDTVVLSGFKINQEQEREDEGLSTPFCFEFLAEKPVS